MCSLFTVTSLCTKTATVKIGWLLTLVDKWGASIQKMITCFSIAPPTKQLSGVTKPGLKLSRVHKGRTWQTMVLGKRATCSSWKWDCMQEWFNLQCARIMGISSWGIKLNHKHFWIWPPGQSVKKKGACWPHLDTNQNHGPYFFMVLLVSTFFSMSWSTISVLMAWKPHVTHVLLFQHTHTLWLEPKVLPRS